MIGRLRHIVQRLALVICVAALTGCAIPQSHSDQMRGVPLQTEKGGIISTEIKMLPDSWVGTYQLIYQGLTADGRVVLWYSWRKPGFGEQGLLSDRTWTVEEWNERFARGLNQIYILDASPSTLKYELATPVGKFFLDIENVRECFGPSGEKRNKPPCFWAN